MLRSALVPIALRMPTDWDERKNYKTWRRGTNSKTAHTSSKAHTHRQIVPGCFERWASENGWGGEVCCEWLGLSRGLSAAAAETQSLGCLYRFVSSSLGFLLRVPLLLQALGVALSHGVDDGGDKVADHDQHHLLENPRQPVLILGSQKRGACAIN